MYSFPKDSFGSFSEAQQAFAIAQLDPFHDTPYRLEGAPSDANSDSVVMVYNQERTFTAADFGLSTAEGSKFDLHFAILPIVQTATFYSSRLDAPTRLVSTGTGVESPYTNLYPISVHAANSGGKTFSYAVGSPDILGVNPNIGGFFSNTSSGIFVPRNMRTIGMSFEVIDETPKFYQQGSCTTYSRPSCTVNRFLYTWGGVPAGYATTVYRQVQSTCIATPPNDIKQATILPNSKTWKASEGAYVVGKLFSSDNDFERLSTNDVVFYAPNDPDDANLRNCFVSREQFNQALEPQTANWSDSFNRSVPYNISGAYFTGVSGQYGTFRLRSKLIFEILPDPSDTSLITLSTPTIPRDPMFEQLLSKTVALMPAGVPQTMNPKGELWGLVLKTAKKAGKAIASNPVGFVKTAANVGAALSGNPMPLAGQVVGAATKGITRAEARRQKQAENKRKFALAAQNRQPLVSDRIPAFKK